MKFLELRFKNFLSYGNNMFVLRLDTNKTVNIVGNNGHGKSVFLDAIHYALTGKPFRKIKVSQIQNTINKKNCLVELDLQMGSTDITIKRGVNPSIFEIIKNGVPLKEEATTGDFQKVLENILNFNPKTLKHSIIMSSMNYSPFLEMSAADKRLFLDDLLNVDVFTKMSVYLKKEFSILKDDIREQESIISGLESNLAIIREMNEKAKINNDSLIADLLSSIERGIEENQKNKTAAKEEFIRKSSVEILELETGVEKAVETFKTNNQKEVENTNQYLDKLKKELIELALKINQHREKIGGFRSKKENLKELIDEKSTFIKTKVDELNQKRKEYTDNLTIVNNKMIVLNKDIINAKKELLYLENHVTCFECKQQIDPSFKSREQKKYNDIIDSNNLELKKCEEEKNELALFKEKIVSFENKIKNVQQKVEELNKEYNSVNIESIKNDESIISIHKMIEEKEKNITYNDKKLIDLVKNFDNNIVNIREDYQKRINRLKDNVQPKLNSIEEEFDSRFKTYVEGIKKQIQKLSEPNKAELKDENVILVQLLEEKKKLDGLNYKKKIHETSIGMCSDKSIKALIVNKYIPIINKHVNEYLDVLEAPYRLKFDEEFNETIVARGYEKLSYGNFSSGERARCDLALLFAFLDVSKIKNSISSNILILDEVADSSLDRKGISGVISIISRLKNKGYSVFVISHREEIKHDFEVTYVAKKDVFSKLEEM